MPRAASPYSIDAQIARRARSAHGTVFTPAALTTPMLEIARKRLRALVKLELRGGRLR